MDTVNSGIKQDSNFLNLKEIPQNKVRSEINIEYYGAAEPPVRCGESHLSGLTEPPQFVY